MAWVIPHNYLRGHTCNFVGCGDAGTGYLMGLERLEVVSAVLSGMYVAFGGYMAFCRLCVGFLRALRSSMYCTCFQLF